MRSGVSGPQRRSQRWQSHPHPLLQGSQADHLERASRPCLRLLRWHPTLTDLVICPQPPLLHTHPDLHQDPEVERLERASRPGGWQGQGRDEVLQSMYGRAASAPKGTAPGCMLCGMSEVTGACVQAACMRA